jgi:hypothetical protein
MEAFSIIIVSRLGCQTIFHSLTKYSWLKNDHVQCSLQDIIAMADDRLESARIGHSQTRITGSRCSL